MSLLAQNILVVLIVLGCLAVVVAQASASLRGKKSKLGSCCSKGCQPPPAVGGGKAKTERIVFLPVEMLGRKR